MLDNAEGIDNVKHILLKGKASGISDDIGCRRFPASVGDVDTNKKSVTVRHQLSRHPPVTDPDIEHSGRLVARFSQIFKETLLLKVDAPSVLLLLPSIY